MDNVLNIDLNNKKSALNEIKKQNELLKQSVQEKKSKHTLYSKNGSKTYILMDGKINIVL